MLKLLKLSVLTIFASVIAVEEVDPELVENPDEAEETKSDRCSGYNTLQVEG